MLLLMREEKPIGYPLLCAPQLVQGGQAKLPITATPTANGEIFALRHLAITMKLEIQGLIMAMPILRGKVDNWRN